MDNYIYGGISGLCEVCVSHPLDYYKVKVQNTKYRLNIIKFYRDNINKNGIKSLYKGYIPKVSGTIPMRVLFWGTQNHINKICDNRGIKDYKKYLLSGFTAGFTQTLIDNPIEVMKIQLMTGAKKFKDIKYKNLYNGFKYTLLRNTIFSIGVCYGNLISKNENKINNFITTGIFAYLASIITQPLDYLKTKAQKYNKKEKYNNQIKYNKEKIKSIKINKIKKMFVGMTPRAMVSFINMGVGCVVFNLLDEYFKN